MSKANSVLVPFTFFDEASPRSFALNPLLMLPQELRDHIYDELFDGAFFIFRDGIYKVTIIDPRHPNKKPARLPNWLRACKQLLAEGTAYMHRITTCVRVSDGFHYPYRQMCPYQLLSMHQIQKLDLSSPAMAFALEIQDADDNYNVISDVRVGTLAGPRLRHLCEHLRVHGHRLDLLKLRFVFPDRRELREMCKDQWVVDLSYIERLGSDFKQVELKIESPRAGPEDVRYEQSLQSLHKLIQMELERVTMYLLGESADI